MGYLRQLNQVVIAQMVLIFYDNTDIFLEYNNEPSCSLIGELFIWDYEFIEQELYLRPSFENLTCDEECYTVFRKIADEK